MELAGNMCIVYNISEKSFDIRKQELQNFQNLSWKVISKYPSVSFQDRKRENTHGQAIFNDESATKQSRYEMKAGENAA